MLLGPFIYPVYFTNRYIQQNLAREIEIILENENQNNSARGVKVVLEDPTSKFRFLRFTFPASQELNQAQDANKQHQVVSEVPSNGYTGNNNQK